MKKRLVFLIFLFISFIGFASELSVRLQPGYGIPLNNSIDNSIGINFGAEIAPFTLRQADKINFSLSGSYNVMNASGINSQPFFDVLFGVGYSYRINDRFSISPEINAGLWNYPGDKVLQFDAASGISFGAKLSGDFYIFPELVLSAFAGYKQEYYKPTPFLSIIDLGIGVKYNISRGIFGKSEISLENSYVEPLFPVFYSHYDDHSFGNLEFVNNEPNDITNVEISVFIDSYMTSSNVIDSIPAVRKGETFSVDVTAFLNENMLNLLQPLYTDVAVTVSYQSLGKKISTQYSVPVTLLSRNSMSWIDDRRAAAFVSGRDASAYKFARQVQSIVKNELRKDIPQNIQYAAAMFGALKAYGINYVVDPTSAFTDNVGNASVDFLQFPYQTLLYHGGDCDDLSILNCSLLEAIGIETAFITVPGHIFIAFDSGIPIEEAGSKIASGKYIAANGKVWVPLETTLSQDTFGLAWVYGAREWAKFGEEAQLYPMKEAWEEYNPVSIPESDVTINVPLKDQILKNFKEAKYY